MVGKLLLHRMYMCVRVVRRLARRPMPWRGPLAYNRERSSRDEWGKRISFNMTPAFRPN
jgi:hypothetical protein